MSEKSSKNGKYFVRHSLFLKIISEEMFDPKHGRLKVKTDSQKELEKKLEREEKCRKFMTAQNTAFQMVFITYYLFDFLLN